MRLTILVVKRYNVSGLIWSQQAPIKINRHLDIKMIKSSWVPWNFYKTKKVTLYVMKGKKLVWESKCHFIKASGTCLLWVIEMHKPWLEKHSVCSLSIRLRLFSTCTKYWNSHRLKRSCCYSSLCTVLQREDLLELYWHIQKPPAFRR